MACASAFPCVQLDCCPKALVLVLEFLTKLINLRLELSKCGISIFQRLLVVLLLVVLNDLCAIEMTQRVKPGTQRAEYFYGGFYLDSFMRIAPLVLCSIQRCKAIEKTGLLRLS